MMGDIVRDRSTQHPAQQAGVMGAHHDQIHLLGFSHGAYSFPRVAGFHPHLAARAKVRQNLFQAAPSFLFRF